MAMQLLHQSRRLHLWMLGAVAVVVVMAFEVLWVVKVSLSTSSFIFEHKFVMLHI
jgi:hypothetical protein